MTYKRGSAETRGRKRKLTKRHVLKLNTTRKKLIKEAKGEREINWKEVIGKSRVPKVSPQTASRNLNQHGVPAKWRRPRTTPLRHTFAEAERLEI